MADTLAGKHREKENNNNNCIVNGKDNSKVKSNKRVVKFDSLDGRQIQIPDLYDELLETASTSNSIKENENNFAIPQNQCDCFSESIATPKNLGKIKTEIPSIPPTFEEWINQMKNGINEINKLNPEAIITTEIDDELAVAQKIKTESNSEMSWTEDFELKYNSGDESHDESKNNDNQNSYSIDVTDNFIIKTEQNNLPITEDTCKEIEGTAAIETIYENVEGIFESTPKTVNEKKENRKINQKLTDLLNYPSPDSTERIPSSKTEKLQQEKINQEATTPQVTPEAVNTFNAPLPPDEIPSNNSKVATRKSGSTTAATFKRYCPKCKTSDDFPSRGSIKRCPKCRAKLMFKCKKCNDLFNNHHNLVYHRRTKCSISRLFECEHCDYKTAVRSHMRLHLRRKRHPDVVDSSDFECPNCQKNFGRADSLKRHQVVCQGGVRSENRRSTSDSLKSIERNCRQCARTVAGNSNKCRTCGCPLDFTCLKCQDVFSTYDCIAYHVTGDDCDKLPGNRFHCRNCLRLPRDAKTCLFCPYVANTIFNLIEHQQLYHTLLSDARSCDADVDGKRRPYECAHCGQGFVKKSALRRHEKSACSATKRRSVTIVKCELCNFESKFPYNIRRHMATVHAII